MRSSIRAMVTPIAIRQLTVAAGDKEAYPRAAEPFPGTRVPGPASPAAAEPDGTPSAAGTAMACGPGKAAGTGPAAAISRHAGQRHARPAAVL